MKGDKEATEALLQEVEELFEKYLHDDIDIPMLRKGVRDLIESYQG